MFLESTEGRLRGCVLLLGTVKRGGERIIGPGRSGLERVLLGGIIRRPGVVCTGLKRLLLLRLLEL